MNPKNKAKELYDNHLSLISLSYRGEKAKKHALISVELVLYTLSVPPIENKGSMLYDSQIDYWNQVKNEIKNL